MLPVYLFSLVLGGGLLLLSLFSGDGGDTDLALDAGVDLDLVEGMDAALDAGEIDASADTAASKIFSIRGLIYTAFGFGATGTLATVLGVAMIPALLSSVGVGVLSGALVGWVFDYLRRTDSGALLTDTTFKGLEGRVVLPLSAGSAGAVVVERGGREVLLRALPHGSAPEGDPGDWAKVMVVEVVEGVARVIPVEGDRLLES